jgi:type IV pilus assembly protein PilN
MRLPLNLAREPMRRDRPILVASAAVALLLTASLAALISLAMADRQSIDASRNVIAQVERQLNNTNAEQTKVNAEIRQPQNSSVLDRSVLFNALIHRKAISWTRIFSDLETVLPHNVRIASIRPQLNGQNELSLDMVVAADTPEPVIDFVIKLESSDTFGKVTQTAQTPPTQNDPYYRFRLTVNYDQKL